MKRFALLIMLISLAAAAIAAEFEFSAEGISVDEDLVTTYMGDAVIRAPSNTPYQVKSKGKKTTADAEIYEGDVEITIEKMRVITDKVVLTRTRDGTLVFKMEWAKSKDL